MNRDVINEHYHGDPANPTTERARERIHWICGQAKGQDILDIGCSQGIVCLILAREGFRCTGVDIEAESLEVARQALAKEDTMVRDRVTLHVADASQLSLPDESFDTVVLGEILEHLTHPEKVLAQAKRVLRKGGRLVVTVPYGLNAFPDHKRTYYPVRLLEVLQPLFRTSLIETLGNYIIYTGTKDPAYDPAQLAKEKVFEEYLRLEKALEERCLSKEQQLLETATRLYAQVKSLTTQLGDQAAKIKELEEALAAVQKQAKELETELQSARAAHTELREDALRHRAEAGVQAGRMSDLKEILGTKENRIRELEASAEQRWTALTGLSERLIQAEAAATAQAERVKELQAAIAAKENRLGQLEMDLEKRRSSISALNERVIQAEATATAQASKAKELQDTLAVKENRLKELESNLEEARTGLTGIKERVIQAEAMSTAQKSRIKELENTITAKNRQIRSLENSFEQETQAAAHLRNQLAQMESTVARQNAEPARITGSLVALEQKLAALESENKQHKQDLAAQVTIAQQQFARLEALQLTRLQEREKQHEDLLARREADWKRKLTNQRIREVARLVLPPEARALVISKGDDDLLNLDGRYGLHFPQTAGGIYAGHHPADSAEAIRHLETLRPRAGFLLIPTSSFWWLEYYAELRQHLESNYRLITYNPDACAIFDLGARPLEPKNGLRLSFQPAAVNPPPVQPQPRTANGQSTPAPAPTIKRESAPAAAPAAPAPAEPKLAFVTQEVSRIKAPTGKLRVGCVLDEFTAACFQPECELITFRPDNWKAILEGDTIDVLFVESAWHGNGGSWQYKIASYKKPMGEELVDVVRYCKERKIPTVFWNKEDPSHFDRFIHRAQLFDFVFTSDADLIPKYRGVVKHERVFALPFAAQPKIHNPIIEADRPHSVCFAGAYYALDHDERRADMDHLLRPALSYGLHIYDRQQGVVGTNAKAFQFPEIYQPAIRGRLEYAQMVEAYKWYKVFLNVNSVKQSPTMFSRRVFELLASGTPVISSYSKGIVELLGQDIVHIAQSESQTRDCLERLLKNDEYWAEIALRGIRQVLSQHTYAHRLTDICRNVGLPLPRIAQPRISVFAFVEGSQDLARLTQMLAGQTYRDFELTLMPKTEAVKFKIDGVQQGLPDIPLHRAPPKAFPQPLLQAPGSNYVWLVDRGDYYGKNFLKDAALATVYSDAEVIGKLTHFESTAGADEPKLSLPGHEFRFVKSVSPGSIVAKAGTLNADQWQAVAAGRTLELSGLRVLSIDRFNYVRRAGRKESNLESASDLVKTASV